MDPADEWETTADPARLLDLLGRRLKLPQARRIAVGHFRHVHGGRLSADGRDWLERIQQVADGVDHEESLAPLWERKDTEALLLRRAQVLSGRRQSGPPVRFMRGLLQELDVPAAREAGTRAAGPAPAGVRPGSAWHAVYVAAYLDVLSPKTALIRCQFGNPFRKPLKFRPSWRTPTAVALARQAHDTHAFDRLPILADALEEAVCNAAELLAHLRGPGPHARGCWAVGLVLGSG